MKFKLPWTEIKIWWEDYKALANFINFIIPGIIDKSWMQQDEAKFKRWENAQKLFIKTKRITDQINQELKEPPLKISMPLLENASLESEDELQEKWANLLVNSLTNQKEIKPSYIEILKELSSIEVKILDSIYDEAKRIWWVITDIQFSSEKISKNAWTSIDNIKIVIDNLFRLRLAEAPAMTSISTWPYHPVLKTTDIFQLTFFWVKFIEACKYNI